MQQPLPSPSTPRIAALVVAGGSGERAGSGLPKQYRSLAGETVLRRSVRLFLAHPAIAGVTCVIRAQDRDLYDRSVHGLDPDRLATPAVGGVTRQQSVLNGLQAQARMPGPLPDIVLVHDAARPFAGPALIDRAIAAGLAHGAAVPALPLADTVKRIDGAGRIVDTPPRADLRAVQTPQAFTFNALLAAHRRAAAEGVAGLTDDAAVMEWAGHPAFVFEGEATNVKLTTSQDITDAERRLAPALTVRVGSGYDVHAFDTSRPGPVMLAGIAVPHECGIRAHSDGDVVLHALTDAILGALADGDIGIHFPPSDPQWKGASSDRFVAFALKRLHASGGRLDHVDVTLVCEAPRIAAHREAMRERLAQLCAVAPSRIGLKATTSERMGFTGRREGLAAHVVATVRLPEETVP